MQSYQDKFNAEMLEASKAIANAIQAFGEGKTTIAIMWTIKAKRRIKDAENIIKELGD